MTHSKTWQVAFGRTLLKNLGEKQPCNPKRLSFLCCFISEKLGIFRLQLGFFSFKPFERRNPGGWIHGRGGGWNHVLGGWFAAGGEARKTRMESGWIFQCLMGLTIKQQKILVGKIFLSAGLENTVTRFLQHRMKGPDHFLDLSSIYLLVEGADSTLSVDDWSVYHHPLIFPSFWISCCSVGFLELIGFFNEKTPPTFSFPSWLFILMFFHVFFWKAWRAYRSEVWHRHLAGGWRQREWLDAQCRVESQPLKAVSKFLQVYPALLNSSCYEKRG